MDKSARKSVPPKRRPTAKQIRQTALAQEAIKVIQRHIRGYDARDGYTTKNVAKFSATKKRRLIARARKLKEVLATPHETIKPRSRKERRQLVAFTRQRIPRAKHFIVHKPSDAHSIRFRRGRLSIRGKFPGRVDTESRYFLLPKRPKTPEDVERMVKAMLPEMPEGFYVILTGMLGDTGEPVEKKLLLRRLQEWMNTYGSTSRGDSTGFTEAIIGVRFMSSKLRGVEIEKGHIDRRRERQRTFNQAKRREFEKGIRKQTSRANRRKK